MQINFVGTDDNFIGNAFFDFSGTLDALEIVGVPTSTTAVVENTDTGYITTFSGTGFVFSNGNPIAGTVTSVSITLSGNVEATLTNFAWSFPAFLSAMQELADNDNFQPLADLFNASGPLTVDGSNAQVTFDFESGYQDLVRLITQPITFIGTDFQLDRFQGGFGDDSVQAGSWGIGVDATPGDDTINFSGVTEEFAYSYVDFDDFRVAATIDIDSAANTGSVQVAGFTHTFIDVLAAFEADGLTVSGTTEDDTININIGTDPNDGQRFYFETNPLEGDDTINVSGDGHVRITYNWTEFGSLSGIVADLSTGVVSDGTGGTDQINVSGSVRVEIRATDLDDNLTGSDRDERFITEQGDDTVDGGAGWDAVRYDRSGVGAVFVDLAAGTATGTWDGFAFTDTLSNIEEVRGSRDGDDTLIGSDGNNYLVGRGGDDSMDGGVGEDTIGLWSVNEADATINDLGGGSFEIISAEGTDTVSNIEFIDFADGQLQLTVPGDVIEGTNDPETLSGGENDDTITAGRGDDSVDAGDGNDEVSGDGGMDTLNGGAGDDTIRGGREADTIYGGTGADVIRSQSAGDLIYGGDGDDNIKGGGGNDTIFGENGNDFLKGGSRKDSVEGGGGDDRLFGNSFDDTLIGGGGNDVLKSGGDNDVLIGGTDDDFLKGGTGDDVFVFDVGHDSDVIADWGDGNDVLQISSALANGRDANYLADNATVVNGSLVIDFGGGDRIELEGITDATGLAAQIDIV